MEPRNYTKSDFAACNKGGGELVTFYDIDEALEAYERGDDVFFFGRQQSSKHSVETTLLIPSKSSLLFNGNLYKRKTKMKPTKEDTHSSIQDDDMEKWSDQLTRMAMKELQTFNELDKRHQESDDVLSRYGLTEDFFWTPMTVEKLQFLKGLSQKAAAC
jgi:hypothetical protein